MCLNKMFLLKSAVGTNTLIIKTFKWIINTIIFLIEVCCKWAIKPMALVAPAPRAGDSRWPQLSNQKQFSG